MGRTVDSSYGLLWFIGAGDNCSVTWVEIRYNVPTKIVDGDKSDHKEGLFVYMLLLTILVVEP